MHPDVHLMLHALRAADLRDAAPPRPARRRLLRARLGWTLVEMGLRLATAPAHAPRAA
ncbi:hypothetical protein [Streptomyces sp. SP18CS02]|uniref:hypothetical protein n=1 Tax=Streptomyces sp. SP18CS02 TaxID=3002531 RepID=UPI002E77B341|nr:hypothetical protein [Streptomyces sp. SP18CS02]MEE1752274.1 hypothetical protein [Streptomyces sp. SP18CS02]